tara:strand:- start:776 stop:2476 length:1701 start_codon:yes stop_codon:yes gene_type:complete
MPISGTRYYNNRPRLDGVHVSSVPNVQPGFESLFELNVDRISGSLELVEEGTETTAPDVIYPFIYKSANNNRFRGVNVVTINGQETLFEETVPHGTLLTGTYPMSASIEKEYLAPNHVSNAKQDIIDAIERRVILPESDTEVLDMGYPEKTMKGSKIAALKNTLNYYTYLSPHYAYESSSMAIHSNTKVNWNKADQEMGLLSIPSIFYGREIQKGTVSLKFYITGTLVGELQDKNKNGELVQIGPVGSPHSGSTAGVVLYKEGFMLLTGSWDLTANAVASTAQLNFKSTKPANNDTITLTDGENNTVTFKFDTSDDHQDGRLHTDGTSISVGIATAGGANAASKFRNSINNVTSNSTNGKTLKITATVSSRNVTLTQDTKGVSGNTPIVISSDNVTVTSKFIDGMSGEYGGPHTEAYISQDTLTSPRWIDFAQTIATGSVESPPRVHSSSFEIDFKGTNYVPTITMLAHARKGHLNFSNNPTYLKHGQTLSAASGSNRFKEKKDIEIKNIVSSSYQGYDASYKRQTYISKVGIYDENRNLIGIAKVATPVKKTEDRDFTFKLKLDI